MKGRIQATPSLHEHIFWCQQKPKYTEVNAFLLLPIANSNGFLHSDRFQPWDKAQLFYSELFCSVICSEPSKEAAELYHWMAWTIFAGASRGKGRLFQYQHFPFGKFELQAALIQLWKWKRVADRNTWEVTDMFSHAVKCFAETHLHTTKIKMFLVLTSSGVSLSLLATPELPYHRTLCRFSKTKVCFLLDFCVPAGEVCTPDCQGRYPPHVGMPGPNQTGTCHKSWG